MSNDWIRIGRPDGTIQYERSRNIEKLVSPVDEACLITINRFNTQPIDLVVTDEAFANVLNQLDGSADPLHAALVKTLNAMVDTFQRSKITVERKE